ncbi:MAG: stage V sporulation T C-terminal domain-containing protein [Clostridia bacterium]
MKATGIVRRIDDLGRVVIPKEIRKTLKINEGSPLEIFTNSDGNVIFKKYSPVGEMENLVGVYAQTINAFLSCDCVITDTDKVIAVSGSCKKELLGKSISDEMREFISQRKVLISKDTMQICEGKENLCELVALIASNGDPIGTLVLLDLEDKNSAEVLKILKMMAILIGKHTE